MHTQTHFKPTKLEILSAKLRLDPDSIKEILHLEDNPAAIDETFSKVAKLLPFQFHIGLYDLSKYAKEILLICSKQSSLIEMGSLIGTSDKNQAELHKIAAILGDRSYFETFLKSKSNSELLGLAVLGNNQELVKYFLLTENIAPHEGTLFKAYIADNDQIINDLKANYNLSISNDRLKTWAQENGYPQVLNRLQKEQTATPAPTRSLR